MVTSGEGIKMFYVLQPHHHNGATSHTSRISSKCFHDTVDRSGQGIWCLLSYGHMQKPWDEDVHGWTLNQPMGPVEHSSLQHGKSCLDRDGLSSCSVVYQVNM